ncbi:hypothetical protein HJ032_22155 [Vibrio parahaemolyticus]|nr:hypothetical protein [Vibrio parahaemolyticus]
MRDNLIEAMGLIRVSMSHINNLEKELEVTKAALGEKSEQLDQEIKKNIKLNTELEKLRSDFAQLSLEFNRQKQANISNKRNLVGEELSNSTTQEKTSLPRTSSQPGLEVPSDITEKTKPALTLPKGEPENPDCFNLTGLVESQKVVLLKTKHLHKFLASNLDIHRPRLKLWLTDEEVETFLLAKREVLSNHLSISSPPHEPLTTSKDSDVHQILGPIQNYRTQRGKLLAGWFIDFLPRAVVQSIDPYTFLVKGRFFVREKHQNKLLQTISKWDRAQSVNEEEAPETTQNNTVSVSESSVHSLNTQIEVLDKQFTFRFCALTDDELFSFKSEEQTVIEFNLNHRFIKKASPQSNGSFWDSLKMFIALWATAKVSGLSVNADENSQIAKGRFMRCLKEYMGGCIQYDTEFIKLPSSVLFDSRSTESGIVLLVNDSHPFNETYVQPLPDIEKNIFIQIYAAWLHAERDTLSNITENALKGTREMLGLHFYHLVDEINHGEELF